MQLLLEKLRIELSSGLHQQGKCSGGPQARILGKVMVSDSVLAGRYKRSWATMARNQKTPAEIA
jgi:hypothetical protein